MLVTPLAAQEKTMYVIIAPMTALEQDVAGESPLHQPTMAITKKADTAKVVAIGRINVFTFVFLFANYFLLGKRKIASPTYRSSYKTGQNPA